MVRVPLAEFDKSTHTIINKKVAIISEGRRWAIRPTITKQTDDRGVGIRGDR